mmetsp:Transcript_16019/g.26768  ORF Transcript_16019/g.26768 Transcript_16019/m.26768 type:complete len:85 (-) Transcript_16019:20-274(-)
MRKYRTHPDSIDDHVHEEDNYKPSYAKLDPSKGEKPKKKVPAEHGSKSPPRLLNSLMGALFIAVSPRSKVVNCSKSTPWWCDAE